MSDIKFDIYESPANDGEKKKYHVRNTNKQTIHSKDLIHEATLYTSVSRSDWAAVVEGLKIFYMTQASVKPPTFVFFCNNAQLFHFSYQRYLENRIREAFALEGTPIKIVVRERGEK